ncbi:exonuclease subunit 2 [Enterobacter phage Entb_43]|uniref:Gp46 recombination endonuclease subunit n=1 Tax=Enterobacter phage CC31 TaxID=709484 RepID=E5DI62_9CAUD|nr:SbcC-like subunit of palindrome specific endonuclease [Enterobacter phage CC31]ADB81547.1 gp46 recombination endonuclease subunit [Enterobacter phage CC31]UES35642.1 exonuclease subunit 2 [Enterobacter phage KKP_3262]UVD32433.1 exonuclease subunit 2 [Enterobacter phage Entb_43]
MKIFKLNRVKYQNIMSVGGQPIDIQLDKVHKTLITGKNGAGKSTMLEAITFALFGKPFRDFKKGQLINSTNKKGLLCELWMEYDGHSYYIKRGQKPNVFEIERDGAKLDEAASVKDFQSYFEELIGMSYTSFKQVVVLGTAGYTPFMGLSTPARRKLVEDLLEVSIIAEMDKLNKSLVRELNSQVQVLDAKKDGIQQQIKIYEENIEKQKKLSGENVARWQNMYEESMADARNIRSAIDELNKNLANIVIGEEDDVSEGIQKTQMAGITILNRIESYTKVLSLYDKGGHCPTCLQDLHSSDTLIGQINSKVDECNIKHAELKTHLENLQASQMEYEAVKRRARDIRGQVAAKTEELKAAVERIRKIKAAIDKAAEEFIDYSDEIKTLNEELNKIVDTKSNSVMEKYLRGILTEMFKDSGIKGLIIKKYIPLFNKQINSYLKVMDADYVFTLNEEFNETIKSRGREEFSYNSFSQGEKARIDIALLFTWRDIAELVSGVKINCLFLDEVFDSATDVDGVKSITQILNKMQDSNIFIISHRDHDPQAYGQHLQMKKVGRFTVLE